MCLKFSLWSVLFLNMATQPATPKLNFLVQSRTATKPLTKTCKYFFVMLHVVFSLDFGFIKFKSSKINGLIRVMTLAQSTALCVCLSIHLFKSDIKNVYTYAALFLDVFVYYVFTIVLVVVKNTFHDFQTDLHSFDAEICVDSYTCRVEHKIIVWFAFLLAYRVFTVIYCMFFLNTCESSFNVQLMYSVELIGQDIALVVYTFVFYSAYLRLRKFTTFVKSDIADIISSQYLFKSIAEITEKAKKSFDVVLILSLVANTTDVIMHIYLPFAKKNVKSNNAFDISMAYVIVAEQLLVLFSPAFAAGLLAGQVDKLKLVLYDKLVQNDITRTKDIKRFVSYIEGRPLRFKVWRVVPLDWRLPVIVVNITVTYLIVMIQFTHND